MKAPIMGYQEIWKESVVALTTAEWSPTALPSPLPPTPIVWFSLLNTFSLVHLRTNHPSEHNLAIITPTPVSENW